MRRLGFKRIGEIMPQPRAPFAVRFEPEVLSRLDQALGREPEPLIPVVAPPAYHARAHFLEPILAEEHVLEAATRLLRQLAEDLERDGVGARVLRLVLFQMDGEVQSLDIGLAAPSRDAEHIAQLIGLSASIAWGARWRRTSASRRRPCTCWSPSPCPSARTRSASTRRLPRPRRSAG